MTNLSWDNYPNPTLVPKEGKWYVRVSIPTAIRHCFGSGGGNNNNRAKSTGTNDKSIAQRKMQDLAHKIYKEFDEAQLEYSNRNNRQTDKYAESVINSLAKALKYNKGLVPLLEPSTDYDELVKMKARFDNAFEQVEDEKVDAPSDFASVEAKLDKLLDEAKITAEDIKGSDSFSGVDKSLGDFSGKLQSIFYPDVSTSPAIVRLLINHSQPIVQSYWQDLLTQASIEQGKTPPVFNQILDKDDYIMVGEDADGIPRILKKPPETGLMGFKNQAHHKPISRPRRNIPKSTQYMSDILVDYFTRVDNHPKIRPETKYKRKRGVRMFIKLVGDLPLQNISRKTPEAFAVALINNNPDIAHKTLSNFFSAMNQFIKYCYNNEYIEKNPFQNYDIKDFGKPSEKLLPLSEEELFLLFSHDWDEQEYLLLSLLITTGMRLNEACMLTWERFNDTKYQGYRFFSTMDTDIEEVQVKNEGSKRLIPIHNDIVLPPKGTGRLFDYYVHNNSASNSAGDIIMPIFNQICPHPRKKMHSLRSNFKALCTEASIPKEVHDYLTGHGAGNVGQDIYGGAGLIFKADQVNKIRHPWLNRKSK
jgi:integrase